MSVSKTLELFNIEESTNTKTVKVVFVVIGIQHGDEGKGKIVDMTMKKLDESGIEAKCFRWCGGANAGHTIKRGNTVYKTHIIPSGIIDQIDSYIGENCYVNFESLKKEIETLESQGVKNIKEHLFISSNATVVEQKHIDYDKAHDLVGTTLQGIGPAAADLHYRTAKKVRDFRSDFETICTVLDDFDSIYENMKPETVLVFEGAQSLELSLNSDNYPYVTSSDTSFVTLFSTKVPYHYNFTTIFVAKMYDTYVGKLAFQPKDDPILDWIADEGHEYGVTSGRRRQVNYLDITNFRKFIRNNTKDQSCIVFNKGDVLQQVHEKYNCNPFIVKDGNTVHKFRSLQQMKDYLVSLNLCDNIMFSESADSNDSIFD